MNYPCIFVHRDSGFVQVVLDFHVLIDAHRVDGCEEHSETFFLLESIRPGCGVRLVSVPDVVDVLGEVIRQQYIVLQRRQREHILSVLGLLGNTGIVCRIRVQAY